MIGALAALLLFAQPSASQLSVRDTAAGSHLTVYLMTMGPGDQVWEKFGHNAIWIHDAAANTNLAYHWGLFDFADEDFMSNFLKGDMRYSMGGFDAVETLDFYRRSNRTVWAQELEMTAPQKQRLLEFVTWNLRPENRFYSYDYYRDNCSTRIRDALDAALGGAIKRQSGDLARVSGAQSSSYRFHTRRLTQDDWPVYTGTLLGLGQPVDNAITTWEEMFLPVQMMHALRPMRVAHIDGQSRALVRSERVLFQSARTAESGTIGRSILGFALLAAGIVLVCLLLWAVQRRSPVPLGPVVVAATWSLVMGLAGTGLVSLWTLTNHVYSYRNENVLQATPISLLLTVLLLRLIWSARGKTRAVLEGRARTAFIVSLIILALSFIGALIQALPGVDQVNGEIIALALPLHAAVAGLLLLISRNARALR
ncbi:MAG TPA: DUF4105 domain-containing protein [Gemmatimonadaceae bacterium]|nr:DUF4105 domain-containing protein [Gemmatimonadaceae bacterium]